MVEYDGLRREERLELAGQAYDRLMLSETSSRDRKKRFARPVAFFAGRAILGARPTFVAGYLANSNAGSAFWLSVASLPENPNERGGYDMFLSDRSTTRQAGDYPVYAANMPMRIPPEGEKHLVRVSIPLYSTALPSIDGWPIELLEPLYVNPDYEGRQPLPPTPTHRNLHT